MEQHPARAVASFSWYIPQSQAALAIPFVPDVTGAPVLLTIQPQGKGWELARPDQ